MMKCILKITLIIIVPFFVQSCRKGTPDHSDHNDTSGIRPSYPGDYQWGNLAIGAGGYVTDIIIHPKNKHIMYIRTDVGGAYKWDMEDEKWVQMLNWISPDESNLVGVDGMAIDPDNPDRIYLALGKDIRWEGGVYRSEDRGETWKLLLRKKFAGNGNLRWIGECIAVDPDLSRVIYVGTREDGLWRSTDDGDNWSKVADVPDGTSSIGVRSIVFDPTGKQHNKSAVIYVGIPGKGIYTSSNGGESFSFMKGSPEEPARMQVVNGELYVTHAKGVALWSNGNWQNISPVKGKNYVGLAVNRTNDDELVVAQYIEAFNNPIYRSTNKGKTWEQINTNAASVNLHIDVPWLQQRRFSSASASLAFVPGGSGTLYCTDWSGIWKTPDVWSSVTDWYTVGRGHEETVVLTLAAPPKGALVYSGMADAFGFRHQSINAYPQKKLYQINEGFSIAVCEDFPSDIAVLGAKDWNGSQSLIATSSDFGNSWSNHALPAGSTLGRIAISSKDPDNMVYVSGEGYVYYTRNKGNSWEYCRGVPGNVIKETNIWNTGSVLAADLVDSSFYLFKGGLLYASTDGGETWAIRNKNHIPDTGDKINIAPSPDNAGEIWISLGQNGLWKTSDGGKDFNKVPFFQDAECFSWGASAPGNQFSTAYCYGRTGGKWGLYRSVDKGKHWMRINDDEHQFMGSVSAIAGDRRIFGQVYIGTGGCGIFYGKPAD